MRLSIVNFLTLLTMAVINTDQNQIFQSIVTLQEIGTDFVPVNPIELLATLSYCRTLMSCYNQCNLNPRCRTFVIDINESVICRLYEGSIDTGTVISSSSSTSRVVGIHYDTSLYHFYNQTCDSSSPPLDRYLVCNNRGLRQCPMGTYWNGLMCLNQVYYQDSCNTNEICRTDIGLQCSLCGKCVCNSTTHWNGTFCVPSTCPSTVPIDKTLTALWPFNGNVQDLMNLYNGTSMGNVSFVTGYVGQAMQASDNVYISLPHIDFFQRSFTIELWFYLTDNNQSYMNLFSECTGPINSECLHYGIVPNSQLKMGFFSDDVQGTTSLVTNQWYHVAFVYDDDRRQRFIYLNGMLENSYLTNPEAVHRYLGQSGNAAIGGIPVFSNYFYGYIDHVSIFYRAKTATEILDDASLIAYYSFDCGSTLDSGPNLLHGLANEQMTVTGRVNSALQFNSSNAYFQAFGFRALGMPNQSFTISLWVKPLTLTGTLVHLSNQSTGDGWYDTLLGFNASGYLIAKVRNFVAYGPVIPLNAWTHIVQVFIANTDIYLIVNGIVYYASGLADTSNAPKQPVYVTLANQLSANNNSSMSSPITGGSFAGSIDELRVYNRYLYSSEICALYAI